MQEKLTAENVKLLKPKEKPYEVNDTDLRGFLLRVQPSGVMTYYFSYRNAEGKRQRRRIGKHGSITPAAARDAATIHSADVVKGVDVQAVKKEKRLKSEREKSLTFKGFMDNEYREYCLSTFKTGKARSELLVNWFEDFHNDRLDQITELRITKWRNDKIKAGNKAGGVNRPISALKAMMNKAVAWGVIPRNPLDTMKPLKEDSKGVIRYLSPDEEARLRKYLDDREQKQRVRRTRFNKWREERGQEQLPEIPLGHFSDYLKPMVLLAVNTGMRRGELFSLEWQDIDLKQKTIAVHGEKAKSKTTRIIPLNNEALAVLIRWRNQTEANQRGLVFKSNRTDKRLDNINSAWTALQVDTNLTDFRFHDLRHTFASKLVMKGVDLNTVRELLGHSDIKMTMRYAHLAPEHKAAAVAMLNS